MDNYTKCNTKMARAYKTFSYVRHLKSTKPAHANSVLNLLPVVAYSSLKAFLKVSQFTKIRILFKLKAHYYGRIKINRISRTDRID